MYSCKYCNKEFKTVRGLVYHIQKIHNKLNDYNSRYKFINYELNNIEYPKCQICGKEIDIKYRGISLKHCDDEKCKHIFRSNYQKLFYDTHPDIKNVLREKRINYLSDKSNFNSTAFGNRVNKKLSYLEQWFYDNIIIKYKLTNNYTIINEYKVINEDKSSAYSLDFAFINIKLDVELDGACHFLNGNERSLHDINRDKYLLNNGWYIYRISWYDVKYNEEETIDKFINLLNNNNFIYDKSYYVRYKVLTNKEFKYQQEQRDNKKEQKKNKKEEKYNYNKNIIIDLEKNSNIDFSKFGWVTKANNYLNEKNIIIKQLHRFIKKYYPEFFINNNVFIRMGCSAID